VQRPREPLQGRDISARFFECHIPTLHRGPTLGYSVGDKQLADRVLRNADGDSIVDGVDSGRRPRRSLRFFPFVGRSHLSSQRHGVSVGVNADLLCVDFGAALESFFDVFLDSRPADWRFQHHENW
jgi:hypothetical protein